MDKRAKPDHPVHDLIARRWSPYGFSNRPVSREDLLSLFEAARWAASSYNEQPWRYILATRDDAAEFEQMVSCLVEGNQGWAKAAPVLVICVTSLKFSLNGKPNAAAVHDLGLAAGNLCLEATARGLYVHQMIGILPERAREAYAIPEDYEPKTAMAIGYLADPNTVPDALRERDQKPRRRKPLREFVFGSKFGQASSLIP